MSDLVVKGLAKSFGDVRALREISFTLGRGEFLTLLGPSGCGKTTTLRLIAGFERPDAGKITLDGRSIVNDPPEDRQLGFVFQTYALFPHMNVAKNIAYGARLNRSISTKRRVGELLDLVDLKGFERRKPAELSSGQRQRIALARALAPRPRLLLLDEPLSALDAKLRESLRAQIRHIQQELALSTLYVTHDQEEALSLADRIAVMRSGMIEQIATPQQVYEHPQTEFVASFVGRANRFSGTVTATKDGLISVKVGEFLFSLIREEGLSDDLRDSQLTPGDHVSLFVKEERLQLTEMRENAISAQVALVEYRGETSIVYLKTQIGSLRARVSTKQATTLSTGSEIKVSFSSSAGLLFLAP